MSSKLCDMSRSSCRLCQIQDRSDYVLGLVIHSPEVADWILRVPSMAARRGIFIGIGLGSIATALRVIVGIERTYLGRD